MSRHYSDPARESNHWALPDIEVFHAAAGELEALNDEDGQHEAGWFWWSCFPGCMPDGDPSGPFATEEEALKDAREMASD